VGLFFSFHTTIGFPFLFLTPSLKLVMWLQQKMRLDVQQAKLAAMTLGVALLSTQIKPIWQMLSALVGRLYLKAIIARGGSSGDDEEKEMKVSGLFVHPVKYFQSVSLQDATLDARGFVHDRRFMLVLPIPLPYYKDAFGPNDATHRFLAQRHCPVLATIKAQLDDEKLTLTSTKLPGKTVTISTRPPSSAQAKKCLAVIWNDTVQVLDMGDEIAAFCQAVVDQDEELSDEMKQGVRLVLHDPKDVRVTDKKYTPISAHSLWGSRPSVSFTDGYPILLTNQASLDELNRRLVAKGKTKIGMDRFRPNIVIDGCRPFVEDTWKVISIDGVVFHVVKGCPRCKQTRTDQLTGKVYEEPLETLAEFRSIGPIKTDLYFGQNVIHSMESIGKSITVGATVKVLETGSPVWES
jgi:uncharacterized protein YcbX